MQAEVAAAMVRGRLAGPAGGYGAKGVHHVDHI